ncbi:MAG: cache domain-containing protein [Syntrophaceae bacterium]
MKRIIIAVLICFFFTASLAYAQQIKQLKGTKEEAVEMVKKAVAMYKKDGREKTFAAINDPKGEFQYMDLYIWVIDIDANGLCLARPIFKQLIGQELCPFADSEGKPFMQEACEKARKQGMGWVDYYWANPVTKRNESKSTYFECVKNICFFCGYYK